MIEIDTESRLLATSVFATGSTNDIKVEPCNGSKKIEELVTILVRSIDSAGGMTVLEAKNLSVNGGSKKLNSEQ